MNEQERISLVVTLSIVELSSRVLSGIVGNDLSSKVDETDVFDDAEALITNKLRQRLITKA